MYRMDKIQPKSHIVSSLDETYSLAAVLVESLVSQKDYATVLLLHGDLGAGKTTFTKGIAQAFGIKDSVISPTFILEKKDKIKNNSNFTTLIHIDAYRFESDEEVKVLELGDNLRVNTNIIVIEWPEKLGRYIPQNAQKILFKGLDENTKEIIC
jgi:tRNA threonylcarbamoyladenosine biosynthesis protein TsaE